MGSLSLLFSAESPLSLSPLSPLYLRSLARSRVPFCRSCSAELSPNPSSRRFFGVYAEATPPPLRRGQQNPASVQRKDSKRRRNLPGGTRDLAFPRFKSQALEIERNFRISSGRFVSLPLPPSPTPRLPLSPPSGIPDSRSGGFSSSARYAIPRGGSHGGFFFFFFFFFPSRDGW